MKKSIIEIEYNKDMKTERKVFKNKKTGQKEHKTIQLKDPKCWEIITVQDTYKWFPGQRLSETQINFLTKMNNCTVRIGLPGQFRKHGNNRGY